MGQRTGTMLPPEFSDLEPFAAKWCLATESERFAERLASTMDEMQAFYDAVTPRADAAMTYCDQFPLNDQEVLCRHLHQEVADWIAAGGRPAPEPAPAAH